MNVTEIIAELETLADPRAVASWAKMNISHEKYIGVNLTKLKEVAKNIGRNHALALELWNTCGPGCSPCSRNAPRMMAVAPLPGMPIVTSGMIAPPTEAVAAACGATMPSAMPLPMSCLRRPYCASTP